MQWLCIIYIYIYTIHLAIQKRERVAAYMQGTVFTIYSKIENSSYYQEHVLHPMPVC